MPHTTKKRKTSDKGAIALKKVNRLLATRELKAHYIATEVSAQNVILLNNIAQGDTAETRDGHMVAGKTLELTCTVHASNVQGIDGAQVCEVALVLDKRQQVGVAPNFNDIWQGTARQGHLTNNDFRDRFTILRKKRVLLHVTSLNQGNVGEYTAETWSWLVPFKRGLKLQWDGASGTANIGNGLYLTFDLFGYDVQGTNIELQFNSKLAFTDA